MEVYLQVVNKVQADLETTAETLIELIFKLEYHGERQEALREALKIVEAQQTKKQER